MRNSTVLVGFAFGVLVAIALVAPLYVELPYRLLDDWAYMSSQYAVSGFVAAIVLPTVAGFLAGALDSESSIRSGTAAGSLAVLVGGLLLALPAAEVEANDSLLTTLKNGDSHQEVLRAVASDSALYGTWLPVVVGLLLIGMGPALGAIGGVLYDLYAGSTGRTTRTAHRSSAPLFGLVASLFGLMAAVAWVVQLDVVVLPNLDHPVGWLDRNLLATPILLASLVDCVLVSWVLRDAMLLWRYNLRAFAAGWGGLAVALGLAAPLAGAVMYPQCILTLPPWVGAVALIVTTVATLVGASRSELTLETEARTLGEFLAHGLLTGLVVVTALYYVGVAPILGSYEIAFPYVRALLAGAGQIEAEPEVLVATVYRIHFAAFVAIPLVTATYVVGAAPFWLLVRAYSGRRD